MTRPLPPEPGVRYLLAAVVELVGALDWADALDLAGEVMDRHGREEVTPASARAVARELLGDVAIDAGEVVAFDGQTEREARAKYPPNCPRCAWLPVLGLMRCLPCALRAMAER